MPSPIDRFKSAYNAFMGRDPTNQIMYYGGYASRPDRTRHRIQNERSIVNSIYNRISVDSSSIDIKHVKLDDKGNYASTIEDSLNRVLTKDANVDQTGRSMIRDLVYSLLDEGSVALFPTDLTKDPAMTDSYEVLEARIGKIVEWYPKHVRVEVYNENTGRKEQLIVEKRYTPIIENPFYSIMNEPNSTLQRLIRVLNQLDKVNEQNSSGKMDLIVQIPYGIKSPAQKKFAEDRRKSIEAQLTNSQYGIAYIDGTEKVIQLNRPVENNLWAQAKELKEDLFNQMGLTMEILNGTADEKTMLNYYSRIVEPILTAIVEEVERKWISRTAQAQKQGIRFFRDPFKLVPVLDIAEIADKFTRNEIMTSNEIRTKIGLQPSDDPKADELRNSNLNHPDEEGTTSVVEEVVKHSIDSYITHYGIPERSGRYPWGSGDRPYQRLETASFDDVKKVFNSLNDSDKRELSTGEYKDLGNNLLVRKVSRKNEDPVAFIEIFKDPDHDKKTGFIALACSPEHRGKGYTKELLYGAIRDAKRKGLNTLIWETSKDNIASQKLAKEFGFRQSFETSEDYEYKLKI